MLGAPLPHSDIVEALEEAAGLGKAAVIIDEFQYLVEADPSLPSRLTRSIDTVLQDSELMLVLSGSAVSFFERELTGYRAPLHGRTSARLRVKPLRMLEAWGFFPGLGPVDALRAYTVLGGTPAYLSHGYGARSIGEVLAAIYSSDSPLLDEAPSVLRQELREPGTYSRLLAAVAAGYTEPGRAAQHAGIDPRTVHRYVEVLEELDILRRVTPLGRRRGSRLRFRDPYFMYYYGEVVKLQSLVEAGEEEEARRLAERRLDTHAARVFEDWIWESLPELSTLLGFRVAEAGPWWHRGEEIDLVARSPGEEAAFIEAKWDALSLREAKAVLKMLEAKARKTGLMERRNLYIVVAKEIVDAEEPVTRLDEARILVSYRLIAPLLRVEASRRAQPQPPPGARRRVGAAGEATR